MKPINTMSLSDVIEERCTTAPHSSKHYREGWLNLNCPFCGRTDRFHLGFNKERAYFNCWSCGPKPLIKTLSKLLNLNYAECKKLVQTTHKGNIKGVSKPITVKRHSFKLPPNCEELFYYFHHFKYLYNRGFTTKQIKKIVTDFYIKVTNYDSYIDKLDLKYRIVMPIFYEGEIVSWQTRDTTGRSSLPYIACPKAIEKIEHQTILYNAPETEIVVLCEGIFDVWKVHLAGYPATCCFGVEYTQDQFNMLLRKYNSILVFFDPDKPGIKKGKEIVNRLLFAGKEAVFVKNSTNKDAGDLSTDTIKEIIQPYYERSNKCFV